MNTTTKTSPKTSEDKIFSHAQQNIAPFSFNQEVADVFDDMIGRSIPFYKEIHSLIVDLVARYYPDSGRVFDFGCSTGTTILLLEHHMKELGRPISFTGVDTSAAMIEKAQDKCAHVRDVVFLGEDMTQVDLCDASVVILNYTLQFLKVEKRKALLEKIYAHLPSGGILILSEKIRSPQAVVESCITDLYYDFKRRQGYSELEISQKREALENVLIPLSPEDQLSMLRGAGFKQSEMLFRWYNFASYLGIKE